MIISKYTSKYDIEGLKFAGKLAASILEMIHSYIKPNISTGQLDQICKKFIENDIQAISATLGYNGYKHSTCISINNVVCHGVPNFNHKLKLGDIINIDVTIIKNGYYADTSKMFILGENIIGKRISSVTQECLYKAIKIMRPGVKLSEIGSIIQQHAEYNGYSIVRNYCGHGIGKNFHEPPQVLHYNGYNLFNDIILTEGMCITIEPIVNSGDSATKILNDGWTVVTKDKSLSAQWEHTLLLISDGVIVTTARKEEDLSFIK
ncbi:Methionine aminopeptidase [Candidatus Johnevansia muelleri]|uniref:Methionine aminopeptidase n=1 Tax=Candidatus Johnevansia muelleri TaxID=1495769 RepID=A0A078KH95_9GAMM|nr:Methionine aminopeptidase [Candidatus Evansia muelleri]